MAPEEHYRMFSSYKEKLSSLSPVAIRLMQTDIHAPEHDNWGVVTCDTCEAQFAIGPNRIYGARASQQDCVDRFETLLAHDHQRNQSHKDSYELSD
jgi:hypothetical protein